MSSGKDDWKEQKERIDQNLQHLGNLLEKYHKETEIPSGLTLRCLDECWFSNVLSWLLDPKGSHGLGVSFVKDFITVIAQKRSQGNEYTRRETHFKFGKSGKGVGSAGFSFKNAASMREFYLPGEKEVRKGRACDVVFMDLDTNQEPVIIFIENKLFTTNSPGQLEDMYECAKERYNRQNMVREFVYLTITGEEPKQHNGSKQDTTNGNKKGKNPYPEWVCLSWVDDIFSLLRDHKGLNSDLDEVICVLQWLKGLIEIGRDNMASLKEFRNHFREASAECLKEELNRLADQQSSSKWDKKTKDNKISYSRDKKYINLSFLSHLTLAAQGYDSQDNPLFEKVVLPFGEQVEQVYNLLDLSARDLYYLYFGDKDKAMKYLGKARKQKVENSEVKQRYWELFDFAYNHRFKLHVLLEELPKLNNDNASSHEDKDTH